MPPVIFDSYRPVDALIVEILAAEVEEGDAIAHGGQDVGNQGIDVRNCDLVAVIGVDTTASKATGALDDPEMLAQCATVQVDTKLVGPEVKESLEAIDAFIGIAVVPAIDEAQCLIPPAPVASGMDGGVHGVLHLIEISGLVDQRVVIDPTNMGIE